MASEISLTFNLTVQNGNMVDKVNLGTMTADQAAVGGPTPGYVTIGTTEESIAFGELGTRGLCVMQNLDATNFVEWGFSTGVYGGRLLPGGLPTVLRLNSSTIFLRANTAACKCLVRGYEA